jgi:integrase
MVKITKKYVDSLEAKDKVYTIWDSKLTGFGIKVTPKGRKVYMVRYIGSGDKQRRPALGVHGRLTCEKAREKANEMLSQVATGVDPRDEIDKRKLEPTLNEFFNTYLERHAKLHKKTWKFNQEYYNRHLKEPFGDMKISDITQSAVADLHIKIGNSSGKSMANQIVTLLGMILNKAIEWEVLDKRNPTQYVKKYREQSRDRFLQSHELPLFIEAVEQEERLFRDFFFILLLTGQRKTNVLEMKWKDLNLKDQYWLIPETKNGEPLMVPLVNDAVEILKERKKHATSNVWVFESETSESGRLVDPKKAWARIRKRSGLEDLRMHDLRRTMGSYQTILGASGFIVAKSLGHKSLKSTEIYARLNINPVRESMERASRVLLNKGDD